MKKTSKNPSISKENEASVIDRKVSNTLKRLREQQSMTLAALGEATGLSAAYLSRVENSQACLTLHNLDKTAKALGIPVSAFFEDNAANQPLVITRNGEGPLQKVYSRAALKIQLLAAEKTHKLMEPILVKIKPEQKLSGVRSHPGEEFNHILEGSCQFTYGKESFILNVGDSIYYDAKVPHLVAAHGNETCLLLSVVSSRDYLFHGDLSKLLQLKSREA